MLRRRKARFKVLIVGALSVTAFVLIGAIALAQPSSTSGLPESVSGLSGQSSVRPAQQPATRAAQASQAAAALSDAHPGNRAVAYLSSMAQREIAQLESQPRPGADQILDGFSNRAEEHLIAPSPNPAEAQQLLRQLLQQLRGQGNAEATAPAVDVTTGPNEISVFGRNAVVERDMTVDEASVVGGNLTVRGHVLRDAVAIGGNVTLEPGARVDGDSVSIGGNVQLQSGARVEGDAVSLGGHSAIAEGAWVGGDRTQVGAGAIARPIAEPTGTGAFAWLANVVKQIAFGLVLALLAIIVAALMPSRVRTVITTIRRRPVMSFFSGILTMIVATTATVLLTITLIGIPLVPIVWIGVGLVALLGITGTSAMLGEAMPGKHKVGRSALKCIILGVAVLTLLALIPFKLGWIIILVLSHAALGAAILSRLGAVEPTH